LSQKWNSKISPVLPELLCFEKRVFRVGKNVGNMNCFAFERSSPDGCSASWSDRMADRPIFQRHFRFGLPVGAPSHAAMEPRHGNSTAAGNS
jgi:hypothetical protein